MQVDALDIASELLVLARRLEWLRQECLEVNDHVVRMSRTLRGVTPAVMQAALAAGVQPGPHRPASGRLLQPMA